jgi:hypothetical protein
MKLAAKLILAALIVALVILRADEPVRAPGFINWTPAPTTSSGLTGTSKPREESTSPPRAGEMLSYRISWENFATAATATISVAGRLYFYGLNVWHLQASFSTKSGPAAFHHRRQIRIPGGLQDTGQPPL